MGGASTTALVGILLALATPLAPAQTRQAQSPTEATSEWAKGNRVLVGVTQEGAGFSAQWRFQRSAHGDIVLDLDETRAGHMRAGSLIMVQNGALLARDIALERGRELDTFNGPLLMLQLILRVLERAAPGGPQSIKRDTRVDLVERDKPVKVSGVGAEGEFFAPWSAKGSIGPASGGQIRFELEFVSTSRARSGPPYQTSIAGIWDNSPPPVQLPDSMPLRGWRGFQIKPAVKARGAANTVGLGTSPPMAFTSMGEVRRYVAQWAEEGARRARWQCS